MEALTARTTDPRTGMASRGETVRYAAKVVLLAAVYYVAAKLGLRLSLIHKNVTPLWPPTGIALVAFLLFGRRLWPGVAIGAFLVNLPISSNTLAAGATAAGNTLAPYTAAFLLDLVGFHRELDRQRDALAIVFLGALGSMLISASIGAGTLVLSDAIPASRFLSAWAVWWAGDAMGVLVVTPFLLSFGLLRIRRPTTWARRAEAFTLFASLTAISLLVMRSNLQLLYVVIPVLGWIAWRFQLRGAAPAALIVAGLASWGAAHGWDPFMQGTLLQKMLTLQAFNATVAFTTFFFAAIVTERNKARDELERSAIRLEERVRQRTGELIGVNDQLAAAQRLARVGSWEWDIRADRVTWTDQMFRIYGYQPQEFEVTFEKALERVEPEHLERIRSSVGTALAAGYAHELAESEYTIRLADGEQRTLHGRASLQVGPDGAPVRMVGTVQDVTQSKKAEREHRIAETLQRSLLPDRLPEIPGVLLAARYVPASADMEVGGDWYDVVPLPNGLIGLAIGDVAGHGLRAASVMGQLRMALRAYALEETSPARVVARVHQMVARLHDTEMATLIYGVYDPESSTFRFSNAGHPPPLLVDSSRRATYVESDVEPPLGTLSYPESHAESVLEIASGSTLLLFTDGLVERRGVSIDEGLGTLKDQAGTDGHDLESLCDQLLSAMVGAEVSDDIALLALRPLSLGGAEVRVQVPAEPHVLAHLRQTLRRWLREIGADTADVNELLIACGEAWANAIQHAYGAGEGMVDVELRSVDGVAEVVVRDRGTWRPEMPGEGGRGLTLMRGFMDSVDIDTGPEGTVVRMHKRLRSRVAPDAVQR